MLLIDGAPSSPPSIREILDEGAPAVVVERTPRGYVLPSRTALLSLISASTLTGAVSASIGGERSRKTLGVLLAAAITRAEIVLGKWLAWGGFGAAAALLGAVAAVVTGRVELGVVDRAAADRPPSPPSPSGCGSSAAPATSWPAAATALRVLPAALSLLGRHLVGARGTTPPGSAPSSPSAAACSPPRRHLARPRAAPCSPPPPRWRSRRVMLGGAIRDLDETPDRNPQTDATLFALAIGALAVAAWWLPTATPALWARRRQPPHRRGPRREPGHRRRRRPAVHPVRSDRPSAPPPASAKPLALGRPTAAGLALALPAGAVLAAIGLVAGFVCLPWSMAPSSSASPRRFTPRLRSSRSGAIVADELVFRGWLAARAGAVRAAIVWTVVKAPFDPLMGLGTGAVCGWLAVRTGSPVPSMIARLVWWGLVVWGFGSVASLSGLSGSDLFGSDLFSLGPRAALLGSGARLCRSVARLARTTTRLAGIRARLARIRMRLAGIKGLPCSDQSAP